MFIYDWLYPKRRLRKSLIKYLSLLQINTGDNILPIKRILSIARRSGFCKDQVDLMLRQSRNAVYHLPVSEKEKLSLLYEFTRLVSEIQEDREELDLCTEMARALGYRKEISPFVAQEIYQSIIKGLPYKMIEEKIRVITDPSRE